MTSAVRDRRYNLASATIERRRFVNRRYNLTSATIERRRFVNRRSLVETAKKEIKMTAAEFRRIALSMPEASESAHMDHPDFRVGGKIFATLGYPDANHGMVVLPPEEQKRFVKSDSVAFAPAKGAWGRRGSTCVRLEAVDVPILRRAMEIAWRKRAPKRLASAMRRNQGGAPFSARHNQPGRKLSRRDIGN